MRHTSGIIINDDIFINSNHVVKIVKAKKTDNEYTITIHLSESAQASTMPVVLTFDSESKCDTAFKNIILEMYSTNYALVNLDTKTK